MRYLVIEGDKTPPFQVADILGGDNNMRFSNIFEKYIACYVTMKCWGEKQKRGAE